MLNSHLRNLRLAACLALGLSAGTAAWSKPTIQSINVAPNPLMIGRSFSVTVDASPDVTQAVAVMNTRKAQPELVQVPLAKIGSNWVGSAVVPIDITFDDNKKPEARVKVLVLDAALRTTEEIVRVPVTVPDIAAAFSNGVLTVSCDDQDNTVYVSRSDMGNLLVNNGVIPITGGIPNTNNTSLIRVFAKGGNDIIEVVGSQMPASQVFGGEGDDTLMGSHSSDELDGGPGNDKLYGRGASDVLNGGPGDDLLVGGFNEDQIIGGTGNDEIQWNPGDSSDVIEGQEDEDSLTFFGSNASEMIDMSSVSNRFRFFRNIANITLDCAGVERVEYRALGGNDQITMSDLTGSGVSQALVDLRSFNGTGDVLADSVHVVGTATNDLIAVTGNTNVMNVLGMGALLSVTGWDAGLDQLVVNAGMGDDEIDASAVEAGAMPLMLDGGLGIDSIVGGQGDDVILGGRDNDEVHGGEGDDTFVWNPGDGLDKVEGEMGFDTLAFNGSNAGETIDISANGSRMVFTRNIASIALDCNGIEEVAFRALGGADIINVNDLSGTGVVEVNVSLETAVAGVSDNLIDTITVHGSETDDVATIAGSAGAVGVQGLNTRVNITGSEPMLDLLTVRLHGGADVATAEALMADGIRLTLDGGDGEDILIGGAGADLLIGADGDDLLIGGPAFDILDGGAGNNILIQD